MHIHTSSDAIPYIVYLVYVRTVDIRPLFSGGVWPVAGDEVNDGIHAKSPFLLEEPVLSPHSSSQLSGISETANLNEETCIHSHE